MSYSATSGAAARGAVSLAGARANPTVQAYQLLHVAFVVAPILAGVDKFVHALVNWDAYLAPVIANVLPFSPHVFMLAVGVIEVCAGIGVAFMPRVFAYVVSAWLMGIVVNLLLIPGYFDVALRDFGLALAALALARLSQEVDSTSAT